MKNLTSFINVFAALLDHRLAIIDFSFGIVLVVVQQVRYKIPGSWCHLFAMGVENKVTNLPICKVKVVYQYIFG